MFSVEKICGHILCNPQVWEILKARFRPSKGKCGLEKFPDLVPRDLQKNKEKG